MREIFTYGSVGGALGNQCFYPEIWNKMNNLIRSRDGGIFKFLCKDRKPVKCKLLFYCYEGCRNNHSYFNIRHFIRRWTFVF